MNVFSISLFLSFAFISPAISQELNLDMEDVEAYAKPAMWRIGHDPEQAIVYRLLADSVVKHSGRYSLKIFTDNKKSRIWELLFADPINANWQNNNLERVLKIGKRG